MCENYDLTSISRKFRVDVHYVTGSEGTLLIKAVFTYLIIEP